MNMATRATDIGQGIGNRVKDIASQVGSRAGDMVSSTRDLASQGLSGLRDSTGHLVGRGREGAVLAGQAVRHQVEDRPIQTFLFAFGIGCLVAAMLIRR